MKGSLWDWDEPKAAASLKNYPDMVPVNMDCISGGIPCKQLDQSKYFLFRSQLVEVSSPSSPLLIFVEGCGGAFQNLWDVFTS